MKGVSFMIEKLQEIKDYLNQKYVEREKEIEAILIALLSRQHVLLIGSPGTGKSALVSELGKIFNGVNYFQWLLTRFSTPEELFGPLSIKALEQGVYERNTFGKLPEAHLAFLDEIFKANSAILNSLLTLINERIFYNNGGIVQSPLITIVGSSNEYPEEGEGLEALFDRFLLRFEVDYIKNEQSFIQMLQGNNQFLQPPTMTLDELAQLQFFADMVNVPSEVYHKLAEIRIELFNEGIRPSDRRFKQSISVLKAKALLEGRQSVQVDDIKILENALWENPSQKDIVSKIIQSLAKDELTEPLTNINNLINQVEKTKDSLSHETALKMTKELKTSIDYLRQLEEKFPDREEIKKLINKMELLRQELAQKVLSLSV